MELFDDHRPSWISIEINERFFAETTYFEYPSSPFPLIGDIFFFTNLPNGTTKKGMKRGCSDDAWALIVDEIPLV